MKKNTFFNTKYIISGNIVRKYVYQKPVNVVPNKDKKFTSSSVVKPVNDFIKIHPSIQNGDYMTNEECHMFGLSSFDDEKKARDIEYKLNMKKSSLRRARQNIIDLINTNSYQLKTFVTLTFKDNITSIECANSKFRSFVHRMRYIQRDFKYISVIEFQKRGAVHYHMLCNLDTTVMGYDFVYKKGSKKSDNQKYFEKLFGANVWQNGFVDISPISKNKKNGSDCDNVGAYVTKYMTKTILDSGDIDVRFYTSENKALPSYLRSHKLDKPYVITYFIYSKKHVVESLGNNLTQINVSSNICIDMYCNDLKNYEIVRSNSYHSDYLGNISYYEYNLLYPLI